MRAAEPVPNPKGGRSSRNVTTRDADEVEEDCTPGGRNPQQLPVPELRTEAAAAQPAPRRLSRRAAGRPAARKESNRAARGDHARC